MNYIIKDLYKRFLGVFVLTLRSEQRNEVEFKHFLGLYFLTVHDRTRFYSVTWRTGPNDLGKGFGTNFGRFTNKTFKVTTVK